MMPLHISNVTGNDANNNSSSPSNPTSSSKSRWPSMQTPEKSNRHIPNFIFDQDSAIVRYWTAAVALATLYNAWTIALRIAFPEIRQENLSYLNYTDFLSDVIYLLDIFMQLRIAYLQDGIPVFDPPKIRRQYIGQSYFVQDVIAVAPVQTLLSLLPDSAGWFRHFFCTAGAARLAKLLKFHVLYKFYDLTESFTSNPHLVRVLRLFLNLAIIIHWIGCLYYLLSEYEGLGSNEWVYTNATSQQRFSRKYIVCMYWSAMTLTTIGNTSAPHTDIEYIFTGIIFLTGVFVFATVMGNVGDVISSMNANRQEFQARMDHIQMYLTHKKVPASLQLKIKKWAEYTWTRTKATDESRLLNMLPERLRAEVAVHVHLDSLKKVKIFEQCETGFLCELVLKLRSQVYSPGDYVCRVGETGREMFIINHGKVEVLVPSSATNKDMVVAVLSEGNYFGEISLLRLDGVENRRTADVRSIGYSELLCLSRRDLMSAFVEYPEAKNVLEGQAKKRMKTNLQAQRAFSVDALMKSSMDSSSFDSGIGAKDEKVHDVTEIKAMIQELKNANKVPGRTIWQLIARCEVLQARLIEKEKEIDDSKQRIKDLEQFLFSIHSIKHTASAETEHNDYSSDSVRSLKPNNNKVVKQYSQDEGRPATDDSSNGSQNVLVNNRIIPDLRITRPSETSDDESEIDKFSVFTDNSCLKTSKIGSVSFTIPKTETTNKSTANEEKSGGNGALNKCGINPLTGVQDDLNVKYKTDGNFDDGFKVYSQNIRRSHSYDSGNFTSETSVDHKMFFRDYDHVSMTTSFKDEMLINDAFSLDVHTIPEENEEEADTMFPTTSSVQRSSYRDTDANFSQNVDGPSPNFTYRDLDPSDQEVKSLSSRLSRSSSESSDALRSLRTRSMDMKKLYASLDGVNLDPYDSDCVLRLGSVSSYISDDSSSRRNSWNWDSELEGESDDGGSS